MSYAIFGWSFMTVGGGEIYKIKQLQKNRFVMPNPQPSSKVIAHHLLQSVFFESS